MVQIITTGLSAVSGKSRSLSHDTNPEFLKGSRRIQKLFVTIHISQAIMKNKVDLRSSNVGHITANSGTFQTGYNDTVLRDTLPVDSYIPWHHLLPHY